MLGVGLHAQVTREHTETFGVDVQRILLDVARGRVIVVHGAAGEPVRLTTTFTWVNPEHAKQPAKGADAVSRAERSAQRRAERAFDRLKPRHRMENDRLEIEIRDRHPVVFDYDVTLQVMVDVTLSVPEGTRLAVRGTDTGISIEGDYVGDLELKTDGGTYFVRSVSGDFTATTGGGGITVGVVGGRAQIYSRSGPILAGRLHGPAEVATSTGSVEVQHALDQLKINGDDADLRVGLVVPLPKAVDVETSAGRIVMTVDTNAAVTLDASARVLGRVKMRNLPVTVRSGGVGKSNLVADVNGGGAPVRLRTSGGEIVVIGRVPMEG